MTELPIVRTYRVHGIPLRIATELESLSELIEDRLPKFRCNGPIPGEFLNFEYRMAKGAATRPKHGELLFSSAQEPPGGIEPFGGTLDIYRVDGHYLFDLHKQGYLFHDPAAGLLSGHFLDPSRLDPAFFACYCFLLPLGEALKHRGLYPIHASAVEKEGRAVVIPALSGGGKTTSCLALLRAGYRSLSDDRPLLCERHGRVEILPFPDRFDVTTTTIGFFPELQMAPTMTVPWRRKRSFDAELIYPGCASAGGIPTVVLFPEVAGLPQHRAVPLSKATALQEVLPHSLLVFDPQTATRHFGLLCRLIDQADCYRLLLGRNPVDLPELVDALLESAPGEQVRSAASAGP